MLNMIETWNALWTNISPKTCGGKLNKAAGKRGRSRRRSAYALRRSRNTARAGRSPRSPRLPNCAVFWTARQMTFWGSGTELLSCRTLHRKNCSPAKGARVERRAPPVIYAEILFLPLPSSPPLAPPKGRPFIRSPSAPPLRAQNVRLRRSGKKYCENFAGRGFKISTLLTFPRIFGMIKKSAFCKGRSFSWRKRQRKTNRTYG